MANTDTSKPAGPTGPTGPTGPKDPLDLAAHANTLGNPADWFVDRSGPVPRVARHATGTVEWVIDTHGQLRPFDDFRQGRIAADDLPEHEPQPHKYRFGKRDHSRPAGAAPDGNLEIKSGPSSITGSLVVEDPPAKKKGPDKS